MKFSDHKDQIEFHERIKKGGLDIPEDVAIISIDNWYLNINDAVIVYVNTSGRLFVYRNGGSVPLSGTLETKLYGDNPVKVSNGYF